MTDIATIGLGVDTKGLKDGQRELDNLTAASKRTESAVGTMRNSFKNIADGFKEGVKSALDEAQREADRIAQITSSTEARIDAANNARAALGMRSDREISAEINNAKRAYEDLKNSGMATASELNRAKDSMKSKIRELREEMGKWAGDWDQISKKMQDVGGKMQTGGMYLAGAGAAGTALVGSTVKAYAELEASSAVLKSTMMTTEGISKNFDEINALAIRLGNTLPGTTNDFNVMLSKLLQLGVSEKAILGGVGEAAANLAVVMKVPYEEAAVMTAKLKEAMGVAEEDMLKFMDTIQRVGHQGVDPTQMMYAFARSAGGLKQFGIQGEEASRQIAGLYAQLIKLGASGETVGTSFNSALNALSKFEFGMLGDKRQGEVEGELKRLGIAMDFFDDKTKEFKGIDNMMLQLDKLKNVDTESMQKIMGGIFGGGSDQQFMIALTTGGVAASNAMQEKMAAQADISARVGMQLDTLAAKWEAATGTFQNFLASIGEKIAPQLGSLVDWFGEMSAAAQTFVNENPELAKWLGLAVGGASAAALGAGSALLALGSAIKGIGLALPLIAAGWAGAVAFFTNPLVLAIAGVTAAAFTGYKIGTFFSEQIDSIIKAISDGKFLSLGDLLYDSMHGEHGLITILGKAPELARSLGEQFKEAGAFVIQKFREGVDASLKFSLGIKTKLDDAVDYIKGTVKDWIQVGKDLIGGLWEGIKAEIRKPIAAVKQLAEDLPDWARKLLGIASPSKVFMVIGENIGRGLEVGIVSKVDSVHKAAKQLGSSAVYGMKDALGTKWLQGVLKDYDSLQDEIAETEKLKRKATEQLMEDGKKLTESLKDDLDRTLDEFARFDKMLAAGAIDINVWGKAIYNATTNLKTAKTATKELKETVDDSELGKSIIADFDRIGEAMTDSLSEALMRGFEEGKTWFENFRSNLVNSFSTLVLQPRIEMLSRGVVGMTGMGGAGGAQAADTMMTGIGDLFSTGISSLFAPGAISTGIGMTVGGIAETMGMASAAAGALGGAVATAIPYIGWGIAILSALGVFDGKPSNKAAYGNVDLATGATSDIGNQTGKKQASQETMDARDAIVSGISGFSQILKEFGGEVGINTVRTSIGERDGVQFAIDGGTLKKYGDTPEQALAALFDEIIESTDGLEPHIKNLLLAFNGTGTELLAFANSVLMLSEYMQADVVGAAIESMTTESQSLFSKWKAGEESVKSLAAAFDGSLSSAQELGVAVQEQYQMELALVMQIQNLLKETNSMFMSSIEQVRLSVMDERNKYDYYRTKTDEAYALMMAATDPAMIAQYAADVNKYGMSAYGVLSPEQQSQVSGEFIKYFEDADALSKSKLEESQQMIAQSHSDLSEAIKSVMMDVAEKMTEAAKTMLDAAETPVKVEVTTDNSYVGESSAPGGYEVGYA